MRKAVEWSDHERYELPCPWCGEMLDDLWDYGWGQDEVLTTWCGHCEGQILMARKVDVTYRVAKDGGSDD